MQFYDIFNGDADGICALQQLRLEEPRASVLVTGVKRDVRLLERVQAAAGDELTVLDISLKSNAGALARLLGAGARLRCFDHHAAGELPQHANLKAFIDTAPDTCTSLIVDRYLGGRQRLWAVVAAYGDNLEGPARRVAAELGLDDVERERVRELGECLNYNAYGDSVDDLHYHPADLFEILNRYRDPRDFIEGEPVLEVLKKALADDFERAHAVAPSAASAHAALYVLPDAAWSRRIHGFVANQLARRHPQRAVAMLVGRHGGYTVSVRAPLEKPRGADTLCLKFDSGGGRQAAAGINWLPEADYSRFLAEFSKAFTA
ncbi:MAG TPA: acetyltransferase [Burkholderiales bacterium]